MKNNCPQLNLLAKQQCKVQAIPFLVSMLPVAVAATGCWEMVKGELAVKPKTV